MTESIDYGSVYFLNEQRSQRLDQGPDALFNDSQGRQVSMVFEEGPISLVFARIRNREGIIKDIGASGLSLGEAIKAAVGPEIYDIYQEQRRATQRAIQLGLSKMHETGKVSHEVTVFEAERLG